MERVENPGGTTVRAGERGPSENLLVPAAILEGLPDAVVAADRDGRIVFFNALAEALFGYPRHEMVGGPVQVLWPERLRERYTHNMELYFSTEHPLRFSSEAWGRRRDGSEFVGEMSWGIVETTGGPLLLAVGRDISERHATEARLRAIATMGERALAGAHPTDLASEAVKLLCKALPIAGAEVRLAGGTLLAASGRSATRGVRMPIGNGDELFIAPDGELSDEEMSLLRAVAHTMTVGLARLRGEERIRFEALHDPLTGLANRTLLRDRLEQALARSERGHGATAVLFVDLDGFKQVNDGYGHSAGDAVLSELGARMRGAVRPADTVARLGGDEFVVVCEEVDHEAALALGRRMQDAIGLPITAAGVEHRLSASIGIALGQDDPDALVRDADAAAYRAKAGPGGRVEVFG
jgi:diguanylate cyclase (GGDEF)-like protein/PAS domain S-box-containing protein